MITNRSFFDQTWADVNSPTKEELDSLTLSENLDPIIARDLLIPTPKQQAKEFGDSLYVVLHVPFFNHSRMENSEQEIDFVISEKKLITVRYDSIDALHHFSKQIEVAEILNKEHHPHLFFGLAEEIYKFLFDEIEYMEDQIKEIETKTFSGLEKEMVWSISYVARNLLLIKRTVGAHETVWENLEKNGEKLFGAKFAKDAKRLFEEWKRLMATTKNMTDGLEEIRQTNNSLLTTKQNEVMQVFTIMAFVTFPLSLIAGIFGMNTTSMPIVGALNDFWIIVGIMLAISIAMFFYFKYKKWI
ncbi:MAG TPA: CorA family divalent cation transporter [Candidatus Paceibacterota bacterium]